MLVSTGYGKTINIDFDVYMDMSEQDWKDVIIAGDYGEHLENPFHDSFSKSQKIPLDSLSDEIVEEILKEIGEDSLDITED